MMKDVSLAAAFGRLFIVALLMAAVLLLLRRISKRGRVVAKKAGNRAIELVDRQLLGKAQSVAVLRVQDYTLVVGVTEQRVELLATFEPVEGDRHSPAATGDEEIIDLSSYQPRTADDDFFERLRARSAR